VWARHDRDVFGRRAREMRPFNVRRNRDSSRVMHSQIVMTLQPDLLNWPATLRSRAMFLLNFAIQKTRRVAGCVA